MKAVVGIVVAILVLGGIGFFIAKNGGSPESDTVQQTDTSDIAETIETQQPEADEETEGAVQTNSVAISNSAYSPARITVKKGTTVTWTNNDSTQHDVVPDSPSDDFKGSEGLLSKGESYSFTFDTVGTYTYHCTPHPFMKGTVIVVD